MDLKIAKEFYKIGVLDEIFISRDVDESGKKCWILVLVSTKGQSWTLQTSSKKDKTFISLDTAVAEIEAICDRVSSLKFKV